MQKIGLLDGNGNHIASLAFIWKRKGSITIFKRKRRESERNKLLVTESLGVEHACRGLLALWFVVVICMMMDCYVYWIQDT